MKSAPTISTARSASWRIRWTFRPLDDGASEINFAIAYEFKSRALALLMGAVFDRVFRAFAHAFEVRADKIYGMKGAKA